MVAIISNILLLVALFAARGFAEDITRTTVFRSGADGYHTYRIPSCILTRDGTLLAFCEGRASRGDSGRIHLLVKRSRDGGKTFSESDVVWSDGENTCGNPCAVVDRSNGVIWLLMTHNLGEDKESDIIAGESKARRTVWITSSKDDGITWAKPLEITDAVSKPNWQWYATGPGVGIQLQHGPRAGRLIIPCDYIARGGGKGAGNSHIIYSDDHGQAWKLGGEAPQPRFNESQIVELSDGRVMLNMRNTRPAASTQRGVCISDDGGETFKGLRHDPVLGEPVCQASILRFNDAILFSNPASDSRRINMTVRLSRDDGQSWPISKVLHDGPSAYSCLVALPDGSIGLLYECGEKSPYERIEFAKFKLP
jgi:sialidase-1